jgi:sortase A
MSWIPSVPARYPGGDTRQGRERRYAETVTTAESPVQRPAASGLVPRLLRIFGTTLVVLGVGLGIWAFVVWQWQDPFTSLYTRWQQHKLKGVYAQVVRDYRPVPVPHVKTVSVAVERRILATEAARYRATAKTGAPIGHIDVPRLGLHMLLVNGTDHDSLVKGPGRDERTYMPGQGQLIYIAGHRTTYLAPFAHIDSMRVGDLVTLKMPYATIVYSVTGHVIVDAHDLAVLQSHGREVVALQACHPRFFSSHRYIVWAKPIRVTFPDGRSFQPALRALAKPS